MRTLTRALALALPSALLLGGGGAATAAGHRVQACSSQVWRMTIKRIEIVNNGDYLPGEDDKGAELYGKISFEGNVIWSRSYENAANPKTYNGDLKLTDDDWKLWSERLITVTNGVPNMEFRFQGELTDWDASSGDDRVMRRDDRIDVVKQGEGDHTIKDCPDGCYWGESRITYHLEKISECTECQAA
ncbi:hypothetical protein [Streptomyces sp. NPDC050485]|uniref:hypothetical protein n=1 Tax=Streptomyces sp. NPDC050485 TaxID=3365617 RepID=UPI0037A8A81E